MVKATYDKERDIWVIRRPDPDYEQREDPFYPEDDAPELKRDLGALELALPDNTPVGRGRVWGELEFDERLWTLVNWAYNEELGDGVEYADDPDAQTRNIIQPPGIVFPPTVRIQAGICLHCGRAIVWSGGGERWTHVQGGPAWLYCPDCGAVWTAAIFFVECPFCKNTEIEVHHVAQPEGETFPLYVYAEQEG